MINIFGKVYELIKASLTIKEALIKTYNDEDKGNPPEKKFKLESTVNIKVEEPPKMDDVVLVYRSFTTFTIITYLRKQREICTRKGSDSSRRKLNHQVVNVA